MPPPPASEEPADRYHVARYGSTRHWALHADGELLAVTLYRKGAQAVRDLLHARDAQITAQQARIEELQAAPPLGGFAAAASEKHTTIVEADIAGAAVIAKRQNSFAFAVMQRERLASPVRCNRLLRGLRIPAPGLIA